MAQNGLTRAHSLGLGSCWIPSLLLLLLLAGTSSCRSIKTGTFGSGSVDTTALGAAPESGELVNILWPRIHGEQAETSPPILRLQKPGESPSGIGSDALTLSFDIQSESYPSLALILVHCNHNWQPTDNVFIQNQIQLRSSDFDIQRAPIGVIHYDYSASITFPSTSSLIKIEYSGNYLARVVDYYNNDRVYKEVRFFVAENKAPTYMDLTSDFYESDQTDVLQHGLRVYVEATPSFEVIGNQIEAIDLYRQGEWYSPIVADDESRSVEREPGNVWISWRSFAGKTTAEFSNIPGGNEHRILDLTDFTYYPPTDGVLTTLLSDLPRGGSFNMRDNNGVAVNRFVPLSDNDYVYFEFRLNLEGRQVKEDLAVVGTFNNWIPSDEWRMSFDKDSRFYVARGLIKRGYHEYQYVSGTWDADKGVMRKPDPTLLEGNTTYSTGTYFVVVYYHEQFAGGYDRIIGIAAR